MTNSNEETIKKFDLYLYNDANVRAEKILESMLPMMREAIAKAYVQGFIKAVMINRNKNKHGRNNK